MHVVITSQPDHIFAAIDGVFIHEELADVLKEIFSASSSHGLRKIIIDIRPLEGEFSLMARYDFGRIAAELQQVPVRLAVIASAHQIWPDRFAENVANNRGLLAKVTTDLTDALAWLRQDMAH